MKFLLLLIGLALTVSQLPAQDFDLTDDLSFKPKAMAKAPRKVFVNSFGVHYQVYAAGNDKSSGGGFRRQVVGKTKTSMGVALDGPDLEQFQGVTDQLYKDYVAQLEAKGFEVVDASKIPQIELFEDWQRVEGGTPSQAQLQGYITCTPKGFSYYVPNINKSGKERGTFIYKNPKISGQLDDIIVANVSLVIPFVQLAAGTSLNLAQMGSKMKANVKLELAAQASEQVEQSKGLMSSFQQPASMDTYVSYTSGKQTGATAKSNIRIGLKKPYEISGVVSKEKIVDRTSADVQTATMFSPSYMGVVFVNYEDREASATHTIAANTEAYTSKVKSTCAAFLNESLSEFFARAIK